MCAGELRRVLHCAGVLRGGRVGEHVRCGGGHVPGLREQGPDVSCGIVRRAVARRFPSTPVQPHQLQSVSHVHPGHPDRLLQGGQHLRLPIFGGINQFELFFACPNLPATLMFREIKDAQEITSARAAGVHLTGNRPPQIGEPLIILE